MNSENKSHTTDALNAKIELIDELIKSKSSQLEVMVDSLKRIEGFSMGSKETANKVEEFIKKQKRDLKDLAEQGKLSEEVRSFTDSVIHAALVNAKKTAEENEKLYFIKQGEMLCLKQEVEKLIVLKKNHEIALENAQKQAEQTAEVVPTADEVKEESAPKEQSPQKTRKDKNPNTRVGRTALRLAEARKKSIEASKILLENVSKKRGRKPKAK